MWWFDLVDAIYKTQLRMGDYIKPKSPTAKKMVNRVEKQPMEWEKIFMNRIYDKGLIYL